MEIFGYQISYLEIFGTLFSLSAIILAAKSSIWNWPVSLVGQLLFFLLFMKNQLYGNTILQIYFTIISVYGWFNWGKKGGETLKKLNKKNTIIYGTIIIILCLIGGYVLSFYQILYPYLDATITISSMIALLSLSFKIINGWYLWIIIDILSVILYYFKGLYLVSFEYVIITLIATYGLIHWNKLFKIQEHAQ